MQKRKFQQRFLAGFESQRGEKYVRIENKDLVAYVPLLMFTADDRQAKVVLAEAGISCPGAAWREILNDVASLSEFPTKLIADRLGWNGDAFLRPDGTLMAGYDEEEPAVAVTPDPKRCGVAGTLEGWIEGVAEPLANQSLPMAAVLTAFASPLVELIGRRENFGFELVGPGGTGKSTIQRLAASVTRDLDLPTFNATMAGLESEMKACNGSLLVLDEGNSFYGDRPKGGAGSALKTFAFKLALGKPTQRFHGSTPQRYSYVFLTSSNQPLASIAGAEHRQSVLAASDRLMTLNIAGSRPCGVFDHVPEGFGSAEEFAQALDAAATENYGHAMRVFLQELVDEVASDRAGVVRRIRHDIITWRDRAGASLGNDGSKGRVADAFGLLHAAGKLAKRYKVLPESWLCGPALASVYRDFYVGPKPPRPIDDDIRDHLRKPLVRDLDVQGLRRMGPTLFSETPAFLKRARGGGREARIPPAQAAQHLPNLKERVAGSRKGIRLLSEPGHNGVKREVRKEKTDRMVVLVLPEDF